MTEVESKKLSLTYRQQPFQIEYFLRRGRKQAVLYLHGLGCSKADFAEATEAEGLQSHTLAAFDFPGCGGSPYPDDVTLGIDDLVEITHLVVSELGLGDFVIIGHSMGGLVALLYVRKHGARVKGFINVEGNMAPADCFFSRMVISHGLADFTNGVFDGFRQTLAGSENKGFRQFAKTLESASPKALFDYSSPLVDYSDNVGLIQWFAELEAPKLYMYGSENSQLPYIPRLKDSGCKVLEIANSNHLPGYDNPQDYYQAISHFVNNDLATTPVDST